MGAVIDLGLVYLLQATVLPPNPNPNNGIDLNVSLATAIGFFTAVISNFIWTRLWVYPDSRSRSARRQLAMFTLISVTGGVCRTVWVTLTHSFIGQVALPIALPFIQIVRPGYLPGPVAAEKLGTIVSQMIAMVVVMLWNFFANRYWTYNDVE
jgi:putative flippase GtrA